jgi:WhiB family redox-sensing transcriptional regulator
MRSDEDPRTWRERAACKGRTGDVWFHEGESEGEYRSYAKSFCVTCPVRLNCLATALRLEGASGQTSRFGIWGGLDPEQRHNLYKRRAERIRKQKIREQKAAETEGKAA